MIKHFGAVPEPVEVLWHKPEVAQASMELGAKVGAWDAADASLKTFAHMAVAAQVGCSWCPDINYFQAQNENLDLAKAESGAALAGVGAVHAAGAGTCWSTPRP
jgi:hypothetical protein